MGFGELLFRWQHDKRCRAGSDVGECTVRIAATRVSRLRGLMGCEGFGGVLVIVPCCDIHTFGMKQPLDVAFLDKQARVVRSKRGVNPRSRIRVKGAVCVMERFACQKPWFEEGQKLDLDEACFWRASQPLKVAQSDIAGSVSRDPVVLIGACAGERR